MEAITFYAFRNREGKLDSGVYVKYYILRSLEVLALMSYRLEAHHDDSISAFSAETTAVDDFLSEFALWAKGVIPKRMSFNCLLLLHTIHGYSTQPRKGTLNPIANLLLK
jgi:hypothetical protein